MAAVVESIEMSLILQYEEKALSIMAQLKDTPWEYFGIELMGSFEGGRWMRSVFQLSLPPDSLYTGLLLNTYPNNLSWTVETVDISGFVYMLLSLCKELLRVPLAQPEKRILVDQLEKHAVIQDKVRELQGANYRVFTTPQALELRQRILSEAC